MIINSSAVSMAAKTTKTISYGSKDVSVMNNPHTGEKRFSGQSFNSTYQRTLKGSSRFGNDMPTYNSYGRLPGDEIKGKTSYLPTPDELRSKLDMQLRSFLEDMRKRLASVISRGFFGSFWDSSDNGILNLSSGGNVSVWDRTTYSEYTYQESESLEFKTKGIVKTADGREIEFDMSLEMSREYVEQTESIKKDTVAIMTDPLVISLGSSPVGVSDQKWKFDIDGDGSIDNISMLSKGSAFLAYDKNGDGKINDGTELFGARTGNGFAELSAYDEDGNGWIDENDSIYSKLSVWQKDDAGNDKLMNLKEANVGAIFLGNIATEYSLKSDEDNSHNAQIRKSGMYLGEDGMARSVQQLDMVKALVS
ncbi:MAG: hypothetical protein NC240_11450 [Clostridium sp.]|nr:hypothetical protein [Clostridium sp.]